MDGNTYANRFAYSVALDNGYGHTDGDIDANTNTDDYTITDHRATDADAGTAEPATTACSAVTDTDKSAAPDAGTYIDTDQSAVADAAIASLQEMSIF